ncbi:MAG: SRPBCC family protein [Phycisphaerae bacterium]
MTNPKSIHKEILLPHPPPHVWRALTEPDTLAQWMFPNNFQPHVGHRFTFQVPPNPAVNFEGLTIHCEVLECDPPTRLAFSWSAGPIANTRVTFQLEPAPNNHTRLLLHHAGFDITEHFTHTNFRGAEHGWTKMLNQLPTALVQLTI